MKKLLTCAAFLLSMAVVISSCSDDDDPAPSGGSTTGFKFLAAGRTLTYSFQSPFFTDTVLTASFADLGGSVFTGTQTSLPNNDLAGMTYLKLCSGNIATGETSTVDCANIWMKSSRNVGDIYTYLESGTDSASHEVIAKNVTVTVPAGTFTCDKMVYSDGFNVDTFYFSNDNFIIKYESPFVSYQLKSKNY